MVRFVEDELVGDEFDRSGVDQDTWGRGEEDILSSIRFIRLELFEGEGDLPEEIASRTPEAMAAPAASILCQSK